MLPCSMVRWGEVEKTALIDQRAVAAGKKLNFLETLYSGAIRGMNKI